VLLLAVEMGQADIVPWAGDVSSPFTLLSFAIGFAALIFYLVACYRSDKRGPTYVGAASFLAGGVGLPTAIQVMILAILTPAKELGPFNGAHRVIIVLGGLALLWMFYVAVRDFLKTL
jgi:hypothetical protein